MSLESFVKIVDDDNQEDGLRVDEMEPHKNPSESKPYSLILW